MSKTGKTERVINAAAAILVGTAFGSPIAAAIGAAAVDYVAHGRKKDKPTKNDGK